MCSGGGDGETQSTTTQRNPEPWAILQPYLKELFGMGQQALHQGAGYPYTGPTQAPLSPETLASIQSQLQVAGGPMSNVASQLAGATRFALSPGDVMGLTPGAQQTMEWGMNNPYFSQAIRQATRPVLETGRQLFQQGADVAQGQGAYGGTRDVMVAGDLGRKIAREVGNISSGMSSQNYQNVFNQAMGAEQNRYNQALHMMGQGMALAPQSMQAMLLPSQTYGRVGGLFDARSQEALQSLISQYGQVQDFPWTQLGRYGSVLQGGPNLGAGGTESSTTTAPAQGSSMGSALGGAASGAALGSMVAPGIGTVIGGALGLLSGLL